jgi:ribosomal protein S27AE
MPTIHSYSKFYEQPVHLIFDCEFCGHIFTKDGKLTSAVHTSKFYSARPEEAELELRANGEANLQRMRTALETLIEGGGIPSNYSGDGGTIRLEKGKMCPQCGYNQRMADHPEVPTKIRLLRRVPGLGCASFITFFYFATLVGFIRGVESDVSPYAIPILVGVPLLAVIAAYLSRNKNRVFMNKHGLKKQDLPQPKRPEIQYGQINVTK